MEERKKEIEEMKKRLWNWGNSMEQFNWKEEELQKMQVFHEMQKKVWEENATEKSQEELKQMEKAAKISTILASPMEALVDPADTVQANEDMFRLVQDIPNLYQWVVIDPRNDSTFEQADRMLKNKKCVGMKLHPRLHQYTLALHKLR